MKKALIAVAILAILVFVFFFKAATLQSALISGDFITSDLNQGYYPLKVFLSESLKAGQLPLWCPYLFCGFPALAQGQIGALYPLNLILFWLLRPEYAFNWAVILNFFLGGLFMFIYARSVKLSHSVSLLTAILFTFGGCLVTSLRHLDLINAAIWFPLQLALVEYYFQRRRLTFPILAGAVLAVQIFAGHPQMTFICLLGMSLYYLFKIIEQKTELAKTGPAFLLIIFSGLLLSAAQWLPTLELALASNRLPGLGYDFAALYSYHPLNLITWLLPNAFGNPADGTYTADIRVLGIFWENCAYLGIIPLILAGFALVSGFGNKRQNKKLIFFSVLFGFTLVLAMGRFTPVYYVLYRLLLRFIAFRVPARFIFLSAFSMIMLAAYGLEEFLRRIGKGRRAVPVAGALILLMTADLFAFGVNFNTTYDLKAWYSAPATAEYLQKKPGMFRIYSLRPEIGWKMANRKAKGWHSDLYPYFVHRENIQQNTNVQYGLSSATGYMGFGEERIARLQAVPLLGLILDEYFPSEQILHRNYLNILGWQNVKYIVSMLEIRDKSVALEFETEPPPGYPAYRIYRNKFCLPRAWIAPQARVLPLNKIQAELESADFRPRQYLLLEEDTDWGSPRLGRAVVSFLKYEPMKVTIAAESDANAFLFLSDAYYPGWQAYIDGQETEILRANYAFRAVKLPAGTHLVEFVYRPVVFGIGLIISLLSLIGLLLVLSYEMIKQKGVLKHAKTQEN